MPGSTSTASVRYNAWKTGPGLGQPATSIGFTRPTNDGCLIPSRQPTWGFSTTRETTTPAGCRCCRSITFRSTWCRSTRSDLDRYQAIVVPQSSRLSDDDARKLDAYVASGGRLLLSGKMPKSLTCLGSPELVKTWPERHSMYVKIRAEDKQVLAMDALEDFDLSHLRGEFYQYAPAGDGKSLLRLVHDVTYGPPEKCYIHSISDIPGMWHRRHGKGAAAILPFEIGRMYGEWGNQSHALLAIGTLDHLLETPRRVRVETSPLVEVTHRRDRERRFEWIGLLNHTGQLAASVHAPVPIHDVTIQMNTGDRVKQIRSLTDGSPLQHHRTAAGQETIKLPRLGAFEIVLVEYAD